MVSNGSRNISSNKIGVQSKCPCAACQWPILHAVCFVTCSDRKATVVVIFRRVVPFLRELGSFVCSPTALHPYRLLPPGLLSRFMPGSTLLADRSVFIVWTPSGAAVLRSTGCQSTATAVTSYSSTRGRWTFES